MSYLFSFNIVPPSGFVIDSQTGLITIADNADPFSGNLSVAVFDGVTTDIKTIPIELSAPTITPLLSAESLATSHGGGRSVVLHISFDPIVLHGGGRITVKFGPPIVNKSQYRGGQSVTVGTIRFQPVSGGS